MIEEFFRNGLLKKEEPSKQKAIKSIEKAAEQIENAKKNLEIDLFETAIILAYNGMFQAARAIAFQDGIREKSHFALVRYLSEKHSKELNIGILNKLDFYRKIRHSLIYGLESKANEGQAEKAIAFAERFLEHAREFLGV